AKYVAAPLTHDDSVPICSTVGDLKPSMPTQKEECCSVAPHGPTMEGTIQDPFTSVTFIPDRAAIAYPLQLLLAVSPIPGSTITTVLSRPRGSSSESQTISVTVKFPAAGNMMELTNVWFWFAPSNCTVPSPNIQRYL